MVESPATSRPGWRSCSARSRTSARTLAGLLEVAADNGVKVDGGWTDAYTVDFSGSSGKGDRPLVVSYASSPAGRGHGRA